MLNTWLQLFGPEVTHDVTDCWLQQVENEILPHKWYINHSEADVLISALTTSKSLDETATAISELLMYELRGFTCGKISDEQKTP